ncbi:MAG: hypothetical protein WAN20_21810 [Pseudonocardiaceae bacterium]
MTQQGEGVAQPPYPREPNVHSGGEQDPGGDRDLPPYADRQTSGPAQEEQVKDPQKMGEGISDQREVSQAEREGVSGTDATAASPLGVGESMVKQGNERMYGRSDEAHTSDQVDVGVGGRTENIDPESPTAMQGDQGG